MQTTESRSWLEPDRQDELAALNPGADDRQLARLAVLADLIDEDDAATGYRDPEDECEGAP